MNNVAKMNAEVNRPSNTNSSSSPFYKSHFLKPILSHAPTQNIPIKNQHTFFSSQKLNILSAQTEIPNLTKEEHSAEPLRSLHEVDLIAQHYLNKREYRNYMLFTVGINTGLRCSDLRTLRFFQLIDSTSKADEYNFRDEIIILEQKTQKHNPNRHIPINEAIKRAVTLYLSSTNNIALDDYLFQSESNNKNKEPLQRFSIERILKTAYKAVGVNVAGATHTLRKTFGYQFLNCNQEFKSNNSYSNPEVERLLQIAYNHSSITNTFRYTGVTKDDLNVAYNNMNLALLEVDPQHSTSYLPSNGSVNSFYVSKYLTKYVAQTPMRVE